MQCHFSWQAQYLVILECHFSWKGQYFVILEWHFSWQAQYLVILERQFFVAGAVFGEIWVDSRSAKCCNFQYKMRLRSAKSNLGERAGAR